jgi:hypothetical protein
LVETVCFLIGSAYFVCGSYPEGSLVPGGATDDDDWEDFAGNSSRADKDSEVVFNAVNPFYRFAASADEQQQHTTATAVGGSRSNLKYASLPIGEYDDDDGKKSTGATGLNETLLDSDSYIF